jgi:hypothetical protein
MTDTSDIDAELASLEARRKELRAQRRQLKKPRGRVYCQRPDSCVAGTRGGCSLCHGAKMSAASKAAWADPAVRAKMSAARKAAWADPAVRAKMSAASKAALADPAVRAKMSAAKKAAWADHKKRLPPLTAEQKKIYTKLRAFVGREEALAEARK